MARHRPSIETINAIISTERRRSVDGLGLEDFAGEAPKKKATSKRVDKKISRKDFEKHLEATRELIKKERWDEFKPKNFVFLFAHLHEHVYGTLPLEVTASPNQAYIAAARQLKVEFSGDVGRQLSFLRWTWQREKALHPKRTSDFRISWRYQFSSANLITDYRVYLAKQKTAKTIKK